MNHQKVLNRQRRHFAELRRRKEPAVIVTSDGVRYWNHHGLIDDETCAAPDHPARVGLKGMRPEDRAATERYYAERRAKSGPRARAPRAAGSRTRGSRRTSSSSRSSGPDPGDDDPEPEPPPAPSFAEDLEDRVGPERPPCRECGEDRCAPSERTCSRCRQRKRRAKLKAGKPRRLTWAPDVVVDRALADDRLRTIGAIMEEPPRGARKPKPVAKYPWAIYVPRRPLTVTHGAVIA